MPRPSPRTLPDAAIVGPGRREALWIHGSLAVQDDDAPLGEKMRRRRAEMIERSNKPKNTDGCTE